MANITAKAAFAKVLKEEGVEWYSDVHGGHIWQFMGQISKQGIKMYHMRHEQSGVYCAEDFARTTGKPGVCFGTAWPGYGLINHIIHNRVIIACSYCIANLHVFVGIACPD
jgi:thiamine pyrophosphate-dependent acetolactate synthase large subunit-like protein